ncbi:hypothetical protein BJX99DRAFT_206306 [Aspergillus californicus]
MDSHRPLRSCTLCRQRKVKCDRQQPCQNCVRLDAQCVYPAGPGRAPKRPRKGVEARLLAQLSRLETVVEHMKEQSSNAILSNAARSTARRLEPATEPGIEHQFGRLVIDDMQSCYVSTAPWTRLGDEIEELRDLLHDPASDDDHESIPENHTGTAAILGFRSLAHTPHLYHPPISQAVALLDLFKTNVSPMVHVFHIPTLTRLFWDAVATMDCLDKNVEAVLFSIYYSAVISLDDGQCLALLGTPRASALETYRTAVEQATAQADLLNTQNLLLLQAFVIFLTALRNEDDSRTVWSLTSLVYHIAQAMGLHRDGEAFGLRPLETELRRRLWWHICLLDNRSTEYHGCEPIVQESVFDTKLPLNINDDDIDAQMTKSPPEREGHTEMTFCLLRCEAVRVIWKTGYLAPRLQASAPGGQTAFSEREAMVDELQGRLDDRYLKYCDPADLSSQVSRTITRLMILRMQMAVLSTTCQKDQVVRNRLFENAIEILQLSRSLTTRDHMRKWSWHCKTHIIQWHAVAFVLADICARPPSPECDLAWELVTGVYGIWGTMITGKKGSLWRPIRRLMARARYVRETQMSASQPPRKGHHRWRVAGGSTSTDSDHDETSNSTPPTLAPQPDFGWESIDLPASDIDAVVLETGVDSAMDRFLSSTTGLPDAPTFDIFELLSEANEFAGAAGCLQAIF